MGNRRLNNIVLFILIVAVLTINIFFNPLNIVDKDWIEAATTKTAELGWLDTATKISDDLVIGQSLVNKLKPFSKDSFVLNYYDLSKGADLSELTYSEYTSQIGLHSWLLSILGLMLFWISDPNVLFAIYAFITSLLMAISLSLLLMWIKEEFGCLAFLFSLFICFMSPWIIVMGRSPYWAIWSSFVPMLAMIYVLRNHEKTGEYKAKTTNITAFLTILIYCLFRYEFISTVLVMMTLPMFYYAIKNCWSFKDFINRFLKISIVGVCGLLLAVALQVLHLTFFVTNDFSETFKIMIKFLAKRTSVIPRHELVAGDVEYLAGLNASLGSILAQFIITGVPGRPLLEIAGKVFYMKHFIYLFAFLSLLTLIDRDISKTIYKNRKKLIALAVIIALSLFGAVSWYVLAKKHSKIHNGINYILWFMPCLPLLFAQLGCIVQAIFKDYIPKIFGKKQS